MDALVDDLRDLIERRQIWVIVGAGVSLASVSGARVAGWIGLLEDGISRCEGLGAASADWAENCRARVTTGDMSELLQVAEDIVGRMGGPAAGEYRRWLQETVGALRVDQPSLIEAVAGLGVPLATTNYDGLLEEITGLEAITWRDGAKVQQVLRGDRQAIIHLHGYWDEPESVVLDLKSYVGLGADAHAEIVQQALAFTKSLVFVGFGAGLADPNFAQLRDWMANTLSGSTYRHYRLTRDGDRVAAIAEHRPEERIAVLSYGGDYGDLEPYLVSLKADASGAVRAPGGAPGRPSLPAARAFFGREEQLEQVVALADRDSPEVQIVIGPAGIGKSALLLAAAHAPSVASRFASRRYWVRCDGAADATALVAEIAATVGVSATSDVTAHIVGFLESGPALLILDNAETPLLADALATEELLRALGQIPGLGLIASFRGSTWPAGPGWAEPLELGALDSPAAQALFLNVAGSRFERDTDLDGLLADLDGMSLAIELLAYQAQAHSELASLSERWRAKRTALLERGSDPDDPHLSLAASLELSIGRLEEQPLALLALMGLMPDGVAHADLAAVVDGGVGAAAALRRVGLAFDELPRLRTLKPIRDYVEETYPPTKEALEKVRTHYVDLARTLGPRVGRQAGASATTRLRPEAANLRSLIRAMVGESGAQDWSAVEAALALTPLIRFAGAPISDLLSLAETVGAELHPGLQARALRDQGMVALARDEYGEAKELLERAQEIYKRSGDVLLGPANCAMALAEVALADKDFETSDRLLNDAIALFEGYGDLLGQANCTFQRGLVALRSGDPARATAHWERAIGQFQEVGDPLGEGNCLRELGRVALTAGDLPAGRAQLEQALGRYRGVGALNGMAIVTHDLANAAAQNNEHDEGLRLYMEAAALYERVGDTRYQRLCEAGQQLELGRLRKAAGDAVQAATHFRDARRLYLDEDAKSEAADAILELGRISLGDSDACAASEAFSEAVDLYRTEDDPLLASALLSLGEALLAEDPAAAATSFGEALAVSEANGDAYVIGVAHWWLAKPVLADGDEEQHRAAAKAAWQGIGREDLVERYFPDQADGGDAR